MERKGQLRSHQCVFGIVKLLKACATQKDLGKGSELHAYIREHTFLEKNTYIASSLVSMYAKCGAVTKAQQLFIELPVRGVATWNALIAGYIQAGQGEVALECYDSMQHEGHSPDVVTFTCVLKACGNLGAAAKGEQIHDKLASLGMLENNIVICNTLVDMYAKCGALGKAQQLLEQLSARDVVTWSALIVGYAKQGQGEEALKCYDRMLHEGHSPDAVTFVCTLKACGSIGATAKGEQIHKKIVSLGMLDKSIVLRSSLVDMYVKCGALVKAYEVLEELPVRDVITWTTLIAGYVQQGQEEEALKFYDSMQCEGHSPNAVTFACALKACGSIGAAAKGEQIHDYIVSLGILVKNSSMLGTNLVDMYAKCGALARAQQVLKDLPVRNVVTWNALIAGYAKQGRAEEALKCFGGMLQDGHSPNVVTFIFALKACGSIGAANKGKQIHEEIVSLRMFEKNIVLGSALVDMYAKCGALCKAQQVFEELDVRDMVTWGALIAGYAQKGQWLDALKCFDIMQQEGHCPDAVTFICTLRACGDVGAVAKGEQIHDKIVSLAMLEKDIVLVNTLVDMYARCGVLAKATKLLQKLPLQNTVTWNSLIGGYAKQGQSVQTFNCFGRMQFKGLKPDSTTLVCVLNACSHSGLLDDAEMLFSRMSIDYGIMPDVEHYCCMVDLLGRAGQLNRALVVIQKMMFAEYLPVWDTILGACCRWGEVKIGRLAFEQTLQLDKSCAVVYVYMANIYTAAGMDEDADKIDLMRVANECCWFAHMG